MYIQDNHSNLINKYIEYLFVIFTILQSSIYYYQFNYNKIIITIIWQILIFILFLKSFTQINSKLLLYISSFLLVSLMILLFYYIYYPFTPYYFVLLSIDPVMITIYFCVDLFKNRNKYPILYKFENVMCILAIISILGCICYYLKLPTNMNTSVKWGTQGSMNCPGYFYIDFIPYTNYNFMGMSLLRNTGLFIEAPFYSYLLSMALFINLFLRKNSRIFNKKSIILIIAILSTFSTTGYILIILSIFFAEFKYSYNYIKRSILAVLCPILILLINFIFKQKKVLYSYSVNSSYNVRHDDIIASIHAWSNHFIIGNGLGNLRSIYEYINPLRLLPGGDAGITANVFCLLAYGGIILTFIYIMPTILGLMVPNIRCFSILSFIIFIFEGIMFSGCYIVILSFLSSSYLIYKYVYN